MRRLVLGLLAGATALAALSVAPPTQAGTSTDPTVDQSVRLSFRKVDLTDGKRVLELRVKGSADARLHLLDVVMTDERGDNPPANGTWIDLRYPFGYRTGYRPIRKVSGGHRGGVWRVRIPLDRHLPAGAYGFFVYWEVGGVDVTRVLGKTVTIANRHSDTSPAVLVAQERPAAGATVSRSQAPRVALHLRASGAGVSLVWVCYYNVADPDNLRCDEAKPTSGTLHDGVWTTRLTRLRKLATGDVALRVTVYDRVTHESDWVPADQTSTYPDAQVIPGGRGHLTLTD
jgi:hypothetical protein